MTSTPPPTTRDALLGGKVSYEQPRVGYRVALEAPLLARFALGTGMESEPRRRPFRRVVDLGAGPGAVVLALVATGWAREGVALEPDVAHVTLAERNAHANGLEGRLRVVRASVTDLVSSRRRDDASPSGDLVRAIGGADLVITNPPWFSEASGPIAAGDSRSNARAMRGVSIALFARAARPLLGRQGRFVVAFPSQRLAELLDALASAELVPKRMRFVHPRAAREAQVVFVESKPAKGGGLLVEPPLVVRAGASGEGEAYAREVEDALWGRWPAPGCS